MKRKKISVLRNRFFSSGAVKNRPKSVFSIFSKEFGDLKKSWILVKKTISDVFGPMQTFFIERNFEISFELLDGFPKFTKNVILLLLQTLRNRKETPWAFQKIRIRLKKPIFDDFRVIWNYGPQKMGLPPPPPSQFSSPHPC